MKKREQLQKILKHQQEYINYFFEKLDFEVIMSFIELLSNCKGGIYFTGVGKSGIIAKKIVSTMISTGTRAHYIAPINALHGDIGNLTEEDVVILISKSGETDELLRLIPYIRNKGAYPIAWVSNKKNRLAAACDQVCILPVKRELCPYDLAPTTSAAVQLLFGDFVAMALMELKQVSLEKYAENHPAGKIGKQVKHKVKDLMLTKDKVPLAKPLDHLEDVLEEFSSKRCGCLLIVDEHMKLLGIFTDGDLRRSLQKSGATILKMPMEKLMNPCKKMIGVEAFAWEAMKTMEADQKHPVMVLPVVDENKTLKGLIKMHDILQSGL